jgi:hypothetical protein
MAAGPKIIRDQFNLLSGLETKKAAFKTRLSPFTTSSRWLQLYRGYEGQTDSRNPQIRSGESQDRGDEASMAPG